MKQSVRYSRECWFTYNIMFIRKTNICSPATTLNMLKVQVKRRSTQKIHVNLLYVCTDINEFRFILFSGKRKLKSNWEM